jgi:adenylylsulfate kinase
MPAPEAGFALWFTGLPGAGKSALAEALAMELKERNLPVEILDSDALRARLMPKAGYGDAARDRFYDLIVFLAELLTRHGINVLIAATAPRRAYRDAARAALPRFAEVYVACAPEVCRARDPKDLWARSDAGEIQNLPGAGAVYEAPLAPEFHVHSDRQSIGEELAALRKGMAALGMI